jgi:Fe-S cluster biogenesis protein NfuA
MAKDALAEFIIRQFQNLVRPEGDMELLGVEEGVARVLYRPGRNQECPECIMSAEDLKEILREAFAEKAPHIRDVRVELADY